jgi:hypothetical protein
MKEELFVRSLVQSVLRCPTDYFNSTYESLTGSRYGKRATLSALLPAPQGPTEDASMTESFVLTLYYNTLHVRFHVDGLEGHH